MYKLREVDRGRYDDRGYSNEETIANLKKNSKSSKPIAIAYTIVVISVVFAIICAYFAFMK